MLDEVFGKLFPGQITNETKQAQKRNISEDDVLSLNSEFACYRRIVRNFHRECSDSLSPLAGSKKPQQRIDEYSFQYFYLLAQQCKKAYDEPEIVDQTLQNIIKACENLPGKKKSRVGGGKASSSAAPANNTNIKNIDYSKYDSDATFKWHEILDCDEHTGVATYPEETITEEVDANNGTYIRGSLLEICEATIMKATLFYRDVLNDLIADNKANDFRLLDLGSGRGGPSRFIASHFKKARKLRMMVAANISPRENEFNEKKAKAEGLSGRYYRVDHTDFDDLSGY